MLLSRRHRARGPHRQQARWARSSIVRPCPTCCGFKPFARSSRHCSQRSVSADDGWPWVRSTPRFPFAAAWGARAASVVANGPGSASPDHNRPTHEHHRPARLVLAHRLIDGGPTRIARQSWASKNYGVCGVVLPAWANTPNRHHSSTIDPTIRFQPTTARTKACPERSDEPAAMPRDECVRGVGRVRGADHVP